MHWVDLPMSAASPFRQKCRRDTGRPRPREGRSAWQHSIPATKEFMFTRGSHSTSRYIVALVFVTALSPMLVGCGREAATNETKATPASRIVRTTTVEKRKLTTALTFSGRIEAEDEVNVAFRI